jgi:hypothetical protein
MTLAFINSFSNITSLRCILHHKFKMIIRCKEVCNKDVKLLLDNLVWPTKPFLGLKFFNSGT